VLERYPARAAALVAPIPMFGIGGHLLRHLRNHPTDSIGSLFSGSLPMRPDLLFDGIDDQTAAGYLRRFDRESPLVMLQLTRQRRIGPVYSPVAVVGCRADAVILPTDVRHAADMYGVKPIWLPGAGHLVMLDSSASVCLDIVLDWVDGTVVGRSRDAEPGRVVPR